MKSAHKDLFGVAAGDVRHAWAANPPRTSRGRLFAAVIVLFGLAIAACEQRPVGKIHVFRCADGATVKVIFTEADESMTMYLGKKSYKLKHVPSASGAKYTDGKVVFWNKGKEAFIQIDGEVVHDACALSE
jgi:membrane-bound inhibitor of C-type lysozyme